jgi:Ni/Co efflux regulator RcnB
MFISASTEEDIMKKFGYVIAALAAIAVAAPSIASAETMVVGHRDHHRGARAEFREHREHRDHGWHEGMHRHHGDGMVIVRHRHHEG